jgi:hypothetical protein
MKLKVKIKIGNMALYHVNLTVKDYFLNFSFSL